ncbi:unnamed protein product [Meganyctiphanes norvegica]|uniref:Uncharacterized protein n=1 Tax=Meganyctiphanes norvegica TaxID=48144 RepID=A0AAV2SDZ8_MEGNR
MLKQVIALVNTVSLMTVVTSSSSSSRSTSIIIAPGSELLAINSIGYNTVIDLRQPPMYTWPRHLKAGTKKNIDYNAVHLRQSPSYTWPLYLKAASWPKKTIDYNAVDHRQSPLYTWPRYLKTAGPKKKVNKGRTVSGYDPSNWRQHNNWSNNYYRGRK